MSVGKYIGAFLGIVFGVLLLSFVVGFIATGGDLVTYKFWAPKQENARRQVFEQTQSYVEGKQEYLTKLERDYERAKMDNNTTEAASLRTMILDEASTVDTTQLTPRLQNFISSLRSGL